MEANIKSITVKDGIGREVPYMPQTEEEAGEAAQDYFINGSSASSSYPCPEMQETRPGETVLAELVWQERTPMGNWINVTEPDKILTTRQIWRLVKEEKEKIIKYEFEMKEGKLHCISHTQNVTFQEVHEAILLVKDHIERHIAKQQECPFHPSKQL